MAYLYMVGLLPKVYMPNKAVRQWRLQIQHRRRVVEQKTKAKNQIRALLKNHDFRKPIFAGGWWNVSNRQWMKQIADSQMDCWCFTLTDLLIQLDLYEQQVLIR